MNKYRSKRFLALVLWLLSLSFTQAQQTKEQLAAYYYSHGEYAQAAEIYEGLYDKTSNKFYYQMLLNTYLELGQTRDAERMVEKRMKKHPKEIELHVDLASVWQKKGEKKKAEKQYAEALKQVSPDVKQAESLAHAFENIGRKDLMIETYLKVREVSGNRYLFINEIAATYGSMGNYEAMTQEYLDLLDNSPRSIESIQVSLQRALRETGDERLSDGLRTALIERIREQPNNKSYIEMMIWFSLQMKDFDFALTQAKAIDARFPDIGSEQLYRVADIALSNKDYEVAFDGFATIVKKGPENPQYFKSRMGTLQVEFARLNRNFPVSTDELQRLKKEYEETLGELGKSPNTLPIMRDYASLLAYYDNDVQAAADILYDAIEIPKLPKKSQCEIKLELGDLLLFAGDIWDASLLYMQVEKAFKNDAIGAQAKLSNAKLSYYNNDFVWAKSQLDVLRASTTKLIANDAMELSLLISDNMEDDSTYGMLELYAAADLMLYRNLLDSAWYLLDEISHRTLSHPLLDEVLMQKAKIRMRQSRYEEADSLLEQLFNFYPDDILADDALMTRAKINEERLNRPLVALECYEKLLIDYPVSLYADQARKQYNKLKTKYGR